MPNPRVFVASAVALAAIVVVGIVFMGGSDEPEAAKPPAAPARTVRGPITLERVVLRPGAEELVVSLPDEQLNTAQTTGGATSVLLRCVDEAGSEAIRQRHPWPLEVEYGYPPHVHQPAKAGVLAELRSCRLTGPGIDFTGDAPPAQP